jgi:hypothetical protein
MQAVLGIEAALRDQLRESRVGDELLKPVGAHRLLDEALDRAGYERATVLSGMLFAGDESMPRSPPAPPASVASSMPR